MRRPPTKDELKVLIKAIKARAKPVCTNRAIFVASAIYLQRNEGIEPGITIDLRTTNFNFDERWVEFRPFHRNETVRRPLSDETAEHILSQMAILGTKPGDRLFQWAPKQYTYPDPSKHKKRRKRYFTWNDAVLKEVHRAGFDPRRFDPVLLKWAWLDDNPGIREEEVRAAILAGFVLRWADPIQQEGLFRLLYGYTTVLRPGWAHPQYEKTEPPAAQSAPDSNTPGDEVNI